MLPVGREWARRVIGLALGETQGPLHFPNAERSETADRRKEEGVSSEFVSQFSSQSLGVRCRYGHSDLYAVAVQEVPPHSEATHGRKWKQSERWGKRRLVLFQREESFRVRQLLYRHEWDYSRLRARPGAELHPKKRGRRV